MSPCPKRKLFQSWVELGGSTTGNLGTALVLGLWKAFLLLGTRRVLLSHLLSSRILASELRSHRGEPCFHGVSTHCHYFPLHLSFGLSGGLCLCLSLTWSRHWKTAIPGRGSKYRIRPVVSILAWGRRTSAHCPSSSEPHILFPSSVTVAFPRRKAGHAFP